MRRSWNILESPHLQKAVRSTLLVASGIVIGIGAAHCLPGQAGEGDNESKAEQNVTVHHGSKSEGRDKREGADTAPETRGKTAALKSSGEEVDLKDWPLLGMRQRGRFQPWELSPWSLSLFPEFDSSFWTDAYEPFCKQSRLLSSTAPGGLMPRMDTEESSDKIKLTLEVPGIDAEHLDVNVEDDLITVKGQKEQEKKLANKSDTAYERSFGSFVRKIQLPCRINTDKTVATLKNGVLTITADKLQVAGLDGKKISVKTE